jgi:hypothetical protein
MRKRKKIIVFPFLEQAGGDDEERQSGQTPLRRHRTVVLGRKRLDKMRAKRGLNRVVSRRNGRE